MHGESKKRTTKSCLKQRRFSASSPMSATWNTRRHRRRQRYMSSSTTRDTEEPANSLSLRRGQIYWLIWEPGHGSEQRGGRPGKIIQCDPFNRSRKYTNTIVAAITTSAHNGPVHVAVERSEASRLTNRSYGFCEHQMTVSRDRLDGLMGELDEAKMGQVNSALKRILALP